MDSTITLKLNQVADLFQVSHQTIRRWMANKGLPYVQLDKWGTIRFDKGAVLEWWKKRQLPKPAEVRALEIRSLRKRRKA